MPTNPLPPDANADAAANAGPPTQPTQPTLLQDLAALTGLFNPEVIWHEEELLDKLDEQDDASASPAAPEPA